MKRIQYTLSKLNKPNYVFMSVTNIENISTCIMEKSWASLVQYGNIRNWKLPAIIYEQFSEIPKRRIKMYVWIILLKYKLCTFWLILPYYHHHQWLCA